MYKNDRRMFDRLAVDFLTKLKQLRTDKWLSAQCCDVSAGGVGLYSEEPLIPNAHMEISLNIPNGYGPLSHLGRVVWTQQIHQSKWHSGLEFDKIDLMEIRRVFKVAAKHTEEWIPGSNKQ